MRAIEDPAVTKRIRLYGQAGVRRYGTDYIDRLRESGFDVKVSTVADLFRKAKGYERN